MIKYAIRHRPSGEWYDGNNWTARVAEAALHDREGGAVQSLGYAEAAGKACAPPYEIVPMAMQYAPVGNTADYPTRAAAPATPDPRDLEIADLKRRVEGERLNYEKAMKWLGARNSEISELKNEQAALVKALGGKHAADTAMLAIEVMAGKAEDGASELRRMLGMEPPFPAILTTTMIVERLKAFGLGAERAPDLRFKVGEVIEWRLDPHASWSPATVTTVAHECEAPGWFTQVTVAPHTCDGELSRVNRSFTGPTLALCLRPR